MAVSVIATPPVSPFILSPSYPVPIVVESTVYGGAGITQFRFVAEVSALANLGTKYTVPSDPVTDRGVFDVAELFKLVLKLSPFEYNTKIPLTEMTWSNGQAEPVVSLFQVIIKEQYYNAGVFTTNTGPTLTFAAARGFTELTDREWYYTHYGQLPELAGINDYLPYSGKTPMVYAQRTQDPAWPTAASQPILTIRTTYQNTAGGTKQVTNWNVDRTLAAGLNVVYVPMFKNGQTNDADFGFLQLEMLTAVDIFSTKTLQETVVFKKTLETCDNEIVIMFKDRFHQWSCMTFNRYNFTTVAKEGQSAEAIEGRFMYNVKSADTITANTDWLTDNMNVIVRDCLVSDKMYLVNADGSIEQVTIVDSSVRLRTHDVDGLHQYQLSFTKSLDNFTP